MHTQDLASMVTVPMSQSSFSSYTFRIPSSMLDMRTDQRTANPVSPSLVSTFSCSTPVTLAAGGPLFRWLTNSFNASSEPWASPLTWKLNTLSHCLALKSRCSWYMNTYRSIRSILHVTCYTNTLGLLDREVSGMKCGIRTRCSWILFKRELEWINKTNRKLTPEVGKKV